MVADVGEYKKQVMRQVAKILSRIAAVTKRQLLLMIVLPVMALVMAGCVVSDYKSPGTIVDEHHTIEVDGRKVPIKDIHTETSLGPDGGIVIKRDERHYGEGQKLLDKYLDAVRDAK